MKQNWNWKQIKLILLDRVSLRQTFPLANVILKTMFVLTVKRARLV